MLKKDPPYNSVQIPNTHPKGSDVHGGHHVSKDHKSHNPPHKKGGKKDHKGASHFHKKGRKASFAVGKQIIGVGSRESYSITGRDIIPAQPTGAASLTTLVSITVEVIEIYTKHGRRLYRANLFDFFKSLHPIDKVPILDFAFNWMKVAYDEYRDRFVVFTHYIILPFVDTSENITTTSKLFLAVSKSGSPKGPEDWYFQSIDNKVYFDNDAFHNVSSSDYTRAVDPSTYFNHVVIELH